jgi:hypothetical protein
VAIKVYDQVGGEAGNALEIMVQLETSRLTRGRISVPKGVMVVAADFWGRPESLKEREIRTLIRGFQARLQPGASSDDVFAALNSFTMVCQPEATEDGPETIDCLLEKCLRLLQA